MILSLSMPDYRVGFIEKAISCRLGITGPTVTSSFFPFVSKNGTAFRKLKHCLALQLAYLFQVKFEL